MLACLVFASFFACFFDCLCWLLLFVCMFVARLLLAFDDGRLFLLVFCLPLAWLLLGFGLALPFVWAWLNKVVTYNLCAHTFTHISNAVA